MVKSRRLRWAGHVVGMCEVHAGFLVGRLEGKRPLGRHRRRWEYDTKMDTKGIKQNVVHWTNLAQCNGCTVWDFFSSLAENNAFKKLFSTAV